MSRLNIRSLGVIAVATGIAVFTIIASVIASPILETQITAWTWLGISVILALIAISSFAASLRSDVYIYLQHTATVSFIIFGFAFWSPMWHAIFYRVVFKSPSMLWWFVIGLLVLIAGLYLKYTREPRNLAKIEAREGSFSQPDPKAPYSAVILIFLGLFFMTVMAFIIGPYYGYLLMNVDMSDDVMDRVEFIDGLPETDADNVRIMPYQVGDEVVENRLQYSRNKMGTEDIVYINGTPHWSFTLEPDGLMNSFRFHQVGAAYADMTTRSANVHTIEQDFVYGEGMYVTDNYAWQLRHDVYWTDHKDPFVIPHEGDLYMAVPRVKHEHKFNVPSFDRPIPQPYSVPYFDGVHLLHSDGTIEDLSPEEARSHPVLADQRIYPYDLMSFEVSSTRYRHGILNKWFWHDEEIEIPSLPGENTQPFLITTENGPELVMSAEPWGDAAGVLEVWFAHGQSGELRVKQWDVQDTQTGPERAMQYVRQEHPLWDWSELDVDEPIPTFIDNKLYWNVRTVTSAPLVRATSFVDADTGDVVTIREDIDVKEFVKGEDVDEIDPDTPLEPGIIIEITEDGEVVNTIEVQPGQEITIKDVLGDDDE